MPEFYRLGELPATVGGLSQLRTLSLASCSLQQLSETVGHLQHLITLDLSQNRLQELPASLGEHVKKHAADASYN